MKSILASLRYLHTKGILHRDIKPENLMHQNKFDDEVVLIDFGLSHKRASTKAMKAMKRCSIVGSANYMAPEMVHSHAEKSNAAYGPGIDLWGAGIVMFTLLGGFLPFDGKSNKEIFAKILEQRQKHSTAAELGDATEINRRMRSGSSSIDLSDPNFSDLGEDAKNLIRSLLCADPSSRPTAEEALQHPFFCKEKNESAARAEAQGAALYYNWNPKVKVQPFPHIEVEVVKADPSNETCAVGSGCEGQCNAVLAASVEASLLVEGREPDMEPDVEPSTANAITADMGTELENEAPGSRRKSRNEANDQQDLCSAACVNNRQPL